MKIQFQIFRTEYVLTKCVHRTPSTLVQPAIATKTESRNLHTVAHFSSKTDNIAVNTMMHSIHRVSHMRLGYFIENIPNSFFNQEQVEQVGLFNAKTHQMDIYKRIQIGYGIMSQAVIRIFIQIMIH